MAERTWYFADFMTGDLLSRPLPLRNVAMSSTVDGTGTFSAELDMRDITDTSSPDWRELVETMPQLQPGRVSVVPVIEGATNGSEGAMTSVGLGEWWLTSRTVTHGDPVIRLGGIEFPAYAQHNVLTRNWKVASINPLAAVRQLWTDLCTSGQTVAVNVGSGGGSELIAVPAEWRAGGVTYAAAMDEMAADQMEWTVESRLVASGVVPVRVQRDLIWGAPRLVRRFDFDMIDVLQPGRWQGMGLSLTETVSVDDMCFDLWGQGAGAGDDQIVERLDTARPAGMPRISRTYSSRLQKSRSNLRREIARLQRRMNPDFAPFTMTVRQYGLPGPGPRVGYMFPINRERSHSMPTGESFDARVIGWSWRQPRPGEQDAYELTMERV